MRTVLFWIWTIVWFMVLQPIVWVVQAALTPIELVINCIYHKTLVPVEYWHDFATRAINSYSSWLDI